jgi:zinc protease
MAYRTPTLKSVDKLQAEDKDALALLVLSAVLDGYDGARLERALVQGEGQANGRVADSAGSSASMGRGPSLFMLTGVPAQGKTVADVEAALRPDQEGGR